MANPFFSFKKFTVFHDRCAMKVTTDGCLFGAWCAEHLQKERFNKILDIGTGTGLLALMIAQKCTAPIDAVEIDPMAAEQARKNASRALFPNCIQVINADIQQVAPGGYDAVVCNPPFYEGDLQAPGERKNWAHHSSHLSWEALFPLIANQLVSDGRFYLLLPFKRAVEAEDRLRAAGLTIQETVIVRPSTGHQPFRVMIRGSKGEGDHLRSELAIKDADGQYTPGFIELLKDYYLYL